MSTEKNLEPLARANRWWRVTPLLLLPFLFWDVSPEVVGTVREPVAIEALGAVLPLHVNARVERWMERFQTVEKPAFETLLARRGVYAPMVRGKLRSRGMPEELLYLAMMESGLRPRAVSRVSAVGLWQFMSPTALQLSLIHI